MSNKSMYIVHVTGSAVQSLKVKVEHNCNL